MDSIKELSELVEEFKSDKQRLASFDEAATKQAIILRVLSLLGWSPYNIDEVFPEYTVGGKKVDYSLRINEVNKVFIEVKRTGEELEKHQEQLLKYSFSQGVKLAVLTNGITWWFYLPYQEGDWEQRKFYTIEIYDQEAGDIASKFVDFLHKENVGSGKAIENAESVYKSKQRERLIGKTVPRAWDKLINEVDTGLVGLIAETTEKLCGYKPDDATIEKFLKSYSQKSVERMPVQPITRKPVQRRTSRGTEDYTNKKISSFSFDGQRYEVRTWKEILVKVCEIMHAKHRNSFEQVFALHGRERPHFSKNPAELRAGEQIDGSNIYVETWMNANNMVSRSKKVLSLFGYPENALSVETL
ncbi:MAG: type I restriction endonuclease [Methermicoccaceae archaeon]